MIVAIEGIDGSGKSTIISLISEELSSRGIRNVIVKDPWGSSIGRKIKEIVYGNEFKLNDKALALLYAAARYSLEIPSKALVLMDRCYISSLAYQHLHGTDLSWLMGVYKYIKKPDIVIYLDVDPEIAYERIKSSRKDFGIYEELKYLRRLREAYYYLFDNYDFEFDLYIVDSNRELEEVKRDVLNIILRNL